MSIETPVEAVTTLAAPAELPTALEQKDQLVFELLFEKQARINAQADSTRLQLERLQGEFEKVSRQRDAFGKELALKYYLSEQDKIVPETGAILRAKAR
jgi:hypothetical protein